MRVDKKLWARNLLPEKSPFGKHFKTESTQGSAYPSSLFPGREIDAIMRCFSVRARTATMKLTLKSAMAAFGTAAKAKLRTFWKSATTPCARRPVLTTRRRADEIWVIDCSPEGHQPEVPTRILQGVQQPVCIVLASRVRRDDQTPATIRFQSLPEGPREKKFAALAKITLGGRQWRECPPAWRAAFFTVRFCGAR